MLGFLPTRAYRPGTPGATTFLSPLSGTFNYGWDSFLSLVAITLIAGYGLRDGGPSPVFLEAFVMYLPCIVLAVPIRLFRTRKHRAS